MIIEIRKKIVSISQKSLRRVSEDIADIFTHLAEITWCLFSYIGGSTCLVYCTPIPRDATGRPIHYGENSIIGSGAPTSYQESAGFIEKQMSAPSGLVGS